MISPPLLKKGDQVAFIAPARKVSFSELQQAKQILSSWGLDVVYPEGLLLEDNQFAGSDEERITHIQWCLDNPKIKAVFCVRGGYGTSRVIDKLDFSEFKKSPCWLIGFSDVTVLLNQLYNEGIESIHAPIALLLHQNKSVQLHLQSLLFQADFSNDLTIAPHELNQYGKATGQLIGGNLSVLVNQIGTPSFPVLANGILFLEDLDEYLYHIDRMMVQLDRIGVFKKIKGVVVGYMSGMHDNTIPFGKTAYEIISAVLSKYDLPVGFGFPIGHEKNNQPIVVGRYMCLELNAQVARLSKKSCG